MLYVSGDARHFTAGHNSMPVTIVDASEYGVLVEDPAADPNNPALVFYSWPQVVAITPGC